MARGDHTVYMQFKGKMTKVAKPRGDADRPNFVITWKGLDWSGFRTLPNCEKQFAELEGYNEDDVYEVVERF